MTLDHESQKRLDAAARRMVRSLAGIPNERQRHSLDIIAEHKADLLPGQVHDLRMTLLALADRAKALASRLQAEQVSEWTDPGKWTANADGSVSWQPSAPPVKEKVGGMGHVR